jgi:hypothetical protein
LDSGAPRDAGPRTDGGGGFDAGPRPDGGGCPIGLTDCEGLCVNTSSDRNHCGTCFRACTAEQTCSDSDCRGGCVPDCTERECGSDGCGGTCGTCELGSTCSVDGFCIAMCTPPLTECDGECVDTRTDALHCGGCFRPCAGGAPCMGSMCVTVPAGGESCSSPTVLPASGTTTFTWTGRVPDHTPFSCGELTEPRVDAAFRWMAPRTGTATFTSISATGLDTDTTLAVFSAATCTSTVQLGCDDDSGAAGFDSLLTLSVTAGTTYYIVVSSYADPAPTDSITVTATVP